MAGVWKWLISSCDLAVLMMSCKGTACMFVLLGKLLSAVRVTAIGMLHYIYSIYFSKTVQAYLCMHVYSSGLIVSGQALEKNTTSSSYGETN